HTLTSGSHAGAHGIGCVKTGCCQYGLQIASLCAGDNVCCFTSDTCGGTSSGGSGVAASRSDVDVRITELNGLKTCFVNWGNAHCIEPALLAAVASRETQGGALLDSRGYGDNGNGYGIMQCDIHTSGLDCTRCSPRSCCHLEMMSAFLIEKIKLVQSRHTSWSKDQQLQGGVAAYNYFPSGTSFSAVDSHTTGHDYSNDVIARAQWLKNHYHYY
ncbi:hypothetical protein BaRGS_00021320, partial [Batillaria attramentaria]